MSDPVHKDNDGWYFWDETWASRCGPYESEEEARDRLSKYISYLGREGCPNSQPSSSSV